MADEFTFAVVAGMLATVNPCGFAMLPGYLALVVADGPRASRIGRALAASALMTVGFVTVFGVFGLLSASISSVLQRYLPIVTIVIGLVLVLMGLLLLLGKELYMLLPKPARGAPTTQLTSMFGYGVAFAIASLSCTIGPFLAAAGVSLRDGDPWLFVVYALGMGLVVAVLAVAAALASTAVSQGVRRVLPYVGRISGALLVVTGGYVAYYGVYELRLYHASGSPVDPIVDAAATVQDWLSEFLRAVGPSWLAVVLGVLVGGFLVARRRVRRD